MRCVEVSKQQLQYLVRACRCLPTCLRAVAFLCAHRFAPCLRRSRVKSVERRVVHFSDHRGCASVASNRRCSRRRHGAGTTSGGRDGRGGRASNHVMESREDADIKTITRGRSHESLHDEIAQQRVHRIERSQRRDVAGLNEAEFLRARDAVKAVRTQHPPHPHDRTTKLRGPLARCTRMLMAGSG